MKHTGLVLHTIVRYVFQDQINKYKIDKDVIEQIFNFLIIHDKYVKVII